MTPKRWCYWGGGAASLVAAAILSIALDQHPRPLAAAAIAPRATSLGHGPAEIKISPPERALSGTPVDTSGIDICGKGRASVEVIEAGSVNQYVFALTQTAGDHWRAALLDSSNARARAAGLLLHSFDLQTHRDGPSSEEAMEAARDELVQLAAGGSDPAVYAVATWLCQTGMKDAVTTEACQRISLAQWARLDPDNMLPWLALARNARGRGDAQGETVAFTRAASAHRSDVYDDSMLQAVLADVPREATALDRVALITEVVGYQAALPGKLELTEARHYCLREVLQQDGRRNLCNTVAELLVHDGRTLFELGTGIGLGERLGWDPERTTQLRQKLNTLLKLTMPTTDNEWSCDNVARTNEFIDGRARWGEVRYLEELLSRSNPPPQ